MMLNDENKRDIKKMMKGRALYIALGVCVLAAGIISYTAGNLTKTPQLINETEKVTYRNENKVTFYDEVTEKSPVTEIQAPTPTEAPATEPPTAAVFDNLTPQNETTEPTEEKISFSLPVGSVMGMDYSMGVPVFSQTMGDYRTHNGIDFVGMPGENVHTIAKGRVVSVKNDPSWGNTVEIDHGSGVISKICGLADEGLIAENSEVSEGTVIGVIGKIPVEAAEKEHIHLEIRSGGELVDPLEVLGLSQNLQE